MSNRVENSRYLYIDNLRLLMIILVVMVHFGVTYSGIGGWYLTDTYELDAGSYVFFGLFQSFTQAYFMGFLFLISGYFVTRAYDKKGAKRFIKDRFFRLGVPTLVYMLLVHPFIMYVLLGHTWDRPVFYKAYLDYIITLDFIGQSGPLWFAFALLIFNCIYALLRVIFKNRQVKREKEFPRTVALIVLIAIISICAFLIRIIQPIDTSILNMQLCFFSQYIILFIVGVKAGRYDWFSKISYQTGRRWLLAAFIPGIIYWLVIMLAGGALDGGFDLFKGGLTWQSAAYAIWESFISVAMAMALISIFKERCNKQSKLIKILSDSSFGVYMFHAPIIIALSLAMMNIHLPAVIKFLTACIIGIPLSFIITHYIFRRIPYLRKIL